MVAQIPVNFEFRSNQTFASFMPGSNLELIQHLENLVNTPDEPQILIWGKTGSGKTHLLQACCHLAQQHGLSVFYLNLHHAAEPGILEGLDAFELVCLDEIEYIAGNAKWEAALFGFYNQHRQQRHKLLIASEQAIQSLPIALPDLKTRLNWGLSLKIQALTEAELLTALQLKAHHLGFDLSASVGRFLLSRYSHDFGVLSSLLEELDSASLAAQRKLTIPFLKQILTPR